MMKLKKKNKNKKRSFKVIQRHIFSTSSPRHKTSAGPQEIVSKIGVLILMFNKFIFILFLFLLPTQLGKHFFPNYSFINGIRVDYLSPTIYLTDILVLLLLFFNLKTIVNFFKNKKILIGLGLLLVNVIFAKNLLPAIYLWLKITELLIVYSLGRQIFEFLKTKTVLISFLIAGCFQMLLGVWQMWGRQSLQGFFYWFGERFFTISTPGIAKATLGEIELLRPYGTFSHPNSLSGYFLLLFFFVLTTKKFDRFIFLKYTTLLVFSILIFITFSKIAIITYLILNTLYFLFNMKIKCFLCKAVRILVPATVSLVFLQAVTDPLTIEKRLELIKNSIAITLNNPITGVGINNYLIAQAQFPTKYYLFFNQPVHNIFLLFFAETGLLGGLIFLLMLGLIYRFFKASFYILAVVLMTGMFDHYWLTLQQNWLLMGLIYGSVSSSFLFSRFNLRS